jgi:putative peptide zinc metalloprotease protein
MIAAPLNFAFANASCTDCQTIAVALQLNFASTDAHLITPQNAAVATNSSCTRCATVALAYQVFFTVDDPTQIPPGVQDATLRLDSTLREISTDPTITFDDALIRISTVIAEFMAMATSVDVQQSTSAAP